MWMLGSLKDTIDINNSHCIFQLKTSIWPSSAWASANAFFSSSLERMQICTILSLINCCYRLHHHSWNAYSRSSHSACHTEPVKSAKNRQNIEAKPIGHVRRWVHCKSIMKLIWLAKQKKMRSDTSFHNRLIQQAHLNCLFLAVFLASANIPTFDKYFSCWLLSTEDGNLCLTLQK